MKPFTRVTGIAVPLLRDNIDTDAIIPSREIKSVAKTGLSTGLFAGWRYASNEGRVIDPAFILNLPEFQGATILLSGDNFGCGSSREHAVWALAEYGFRVLLAASFNPIFFRNCVRNGLLPGMLAAEVLREISDYVASDPGSRLLSVDLATQRIMRNDGGGWSFEIAADAKQMLLEGLDAIDQTLKLQGQIEAFRHADRLKRPWVYPSVV